MSFGYRFRCIVLPLATVLVAAPGCESTTSSQGEEGVAFYSDYFVFIASDDADDPLVIPMDFNWGPSADGLNAEFKAWHGTRNPWPIAYVDQDHTLAGQQVPQEIWALPAVGQFTFDDERRQAIARLDEGPELRLTIPRTIATATIDGSDEGGERGLSATRGEAFVAGTRRSGWIIYERIRRLAAPSSGGGRSFRRFHWMPVLIDGTLYHFLDHDGEQSATRWTGAGDALQTETLTQFTFDVIETSEDDESQRKQVPERVRIVVDAWQLDVSLASGGHQTGYGPAFPGGLALYRQSLLESTPASQQMGYGMLELILED